MSEPNLVSIVIPCFRMARYVGDALESIGKQSYANWEIVAVDDCGPEDGTKGIFEAFAARFPDRRIELIRHEQNGGVSKARNTAIAAAKGEWVAFLDPDDYWLPGHLQAAVEVFKSKPETAVVSCEVEAFTEDEKGVEIVRWRIPPWKIKSFPASLVYHNFIQPSAAVVRKDFLDRISGFDTTPEIQHIEDYDLWIRLAQLEAGFELLQTATCRYRKHPQAATSDPEKMRRLHEVLFRKHILFFIQMQSRLLQAEAESSARVAAKLEGPLFKIAHRVDRLLAKLKTRLVP
ncbi:glycosyltransferase [Luteolibacter yonseiensis]|uniref:Glycosyltransferase n=1 Tax=Luteolibacter yonseiensis TaxID=1144680 RepID=A0A934R7Z6_9BACT|nr:glycosyltransferase [Luteolibacter yonseiensis]MBK1817125.1 glycosyltransferase [Luteolibacter yonseiensis]